MNLSSQRNPSCPSGYSWSSIDLDSHCGAPDAYSPVGRGMTQGEAEADLMDQIDPEEESPKDKVSRLVREDRKNGMVPTPERDIRDSVFTRHLIDIKIAAKALRGVRLIPSDVLKRVAASNIQSRVQDYHNAEAAYVNSRGGPA